MKSHRRIALACVALALAAPVVPALAARRTPHQELDAILSPWADMLVQLHPTDAELDALSALRSRAEDLAQRILEARRHGGTQHLGSLVRQLEWTARIARARIEALRAEAAMQSSARAKDQARERNTALVDQLRAQLATTRTP